MLSTTCLVQKLANNYPEYSFKESDVFKWSSVEKIIYYDPKDTDSNIYILHELAHALLRHTNYDRDIQLLRMEADAWDKSIQLAKEYNIRIRSDLIQSNLDSYRDWLHKRSVCPACHAVGIQENRHSYTCLACRTVWRVNDAKNCRLIRKIS